jgi:hypothetical protein
MPDDGEAGKRDCSQAAGQPGIPARAGAVIWFPDDQLGLLSQEGRRGGRLSPGLFRGDRTETISYGFRPIRPSSRIPIAENLVIEQEVFGEAVSGIPKGSTRNHIDPARGRAAAGR